MSHTNSTTNYGLPQFLPTDKPFWLTDINNAFTVIDTAIDAAKDAADAAQGDATQALTDAGNASTAAAAADAKGAGAVSSIADTYDATATYSVGDIVMYNSLLYRCTTAIVTPEAWDGTHWIRITVEDLISALNTAKADKAAMNTFTLVDQGTYNGVYWNIREYHNYYAVLVDGTATATSPWHVLKYLGNGYAPSMKRKELLMGYDGQYIRGSIGFYNGNVEIKIDEAAAATGMLIIPKDLS